MRSIAFTIRLDSLYSIRIPYTWQSALAYPVIPPSAIIGMIANALQRYRNNQSPLYYLDKAEKNVLWAGARLISPAIVKSYITSAITRWEVGFGGKSTNALGRQYIFARNIEVVVVVEKENFLQELVDALQNAPITCGDSESIATIENFGSSLETKDVKFKGELETRFPVPFDLHRIEVTEGVGRVYLVHERCKKKEKKFPLVNYLVPLKEKNGVLYPTKFKIRVKEPVSILKIENVGTVVESI